MEQLLLNVLGQSPMLALLGFAWWHERQERLQDKERFFAHLTKLTDEKLADLEDSIHNREAVKQGA